MTRHRFPRLPSSVPPNCLIPYLPGRQPFGKLSPAVLSGAEDGATALLFLSGGRVLAAGDVSGAVRAWDLTTVKQLGHWEGHERFIHVLAFCPRTGLLYSGGDDSTVLAWEVSAWRRAVAPRLPWPPTGRLDALWEDLASDSGLTGLRATWVLTDHPDQAGAIMRARLIPASWPTATRLAQLVGDLDSPRFVGREQAAVELDALGAEGEAALRKALGDRPNLEARRRMETALGRLERRGARCDRALERIATPEARALLADLAKGAPGARLTREARAALGRMDKQASGKP
jgi:hypothetical protein